MEENCYFKYDSSDFMNLAFTMKKLSEINNTEQYYNDIIKHWSEKHGAVCVAMQFEFDKIHKLHAHGIITVRKHFYKRKLQIQGCYIYITDIYDIDKWKSYINKQQEQKIDNDIYMF